MDDETWTYPLTVCVVIIFHY